MSESSRPTRWPSCASATARLAATVDLPTPPLPLATATTWRTSGIRSGFWAIAFCAASSRAGGLTTLMLTRASARLARPPPRRGGGGADPLHFVAHLLARRRVVGGHLEVHHHRAGARLDLVHEAEGDDVPAPARGRH